MVAQNQGIGHKITEIAILLQNKKEATITAINLAIPAAINLAEFIKHRVKNLHQLNIFERVENSMKTRIRIKLSLNPLDTTHKGYQAPLPIDQVIEKTLEELQKPPSRNLKENTEETKSGDKRGTGRGYRRGRRYAAREKKEGTKKEDTKKEDTKKEDIKKEDNEQHRGRRSRRSRRGGRSDRDNRKNENKDSVDQPKRGSDNAFGRRSRGRTPRRGVEVPNWANT